MERLGKTLLIVVEFDDGYGKCERQYTYTDLTPTTIAPRVIFNSQT